MPVPVPVPVPVPLCRVSRFACVFAVFVVPVQSSGPVVGMVWQGKNVVKTGRVMLGATNPADSAPGTIRGDFALDVGRNVIHGSDSVESAEREIKLWFGADGLVDWTQHSKDWIYE